MEAPDFTAYLEAIEKLLCEEALLNIKVNAFVKMKKEVREKFERALDKKAHPEKYKPIEVAPEDVGKVLGSIIHG